MQEFCQDQNETCLICYDNLNQPYQITSCQHQFCKVCLKEYFEQRIDEKNIDDFTCPLCQKCTDEKQVLEIIDQNHQVRYNEYKNEKFQYQQQRREMIKFYIQNKKALNLCRCPWCEQIFYRAENGCNYIRCHSLECQGKNTFCAQCDVALTDTDHDSHYENNNPFKGKCRILRDGVWVDRSTIFN
ncbi:unnamed protein product [Paramecium primaurelia]|uniref:RBR-type E3 ubiquitin transferase n=2 Tax=Paramecium TaxID=5884 RepID=A0A8S1VGN4_9CILI|nr:unnamed protein product [Paramecium primaurelia]CAD8176334.1 unnamed protein product [Paramecium pentaurelia]